MWNDITTGLISNFLFLIASISVAYLMVMILRRKRLYVFFGIGEEQKVTIYISHFNIQSGGAVNAGGQVRSFTGKAIPHLEMICAQRLSEVFSLPFPGLESQSGILSSFRLSDIRCQVIPSPFKKEEVILDHTIICIGSPGYNIASKALQQDIQTKVKFNDECNEIYIEGLPPLKNLKQGIIVRYHSKGVTYFYLAGLSEFGTASAVIFLRKNWQRLHRVYLKNPSFYVICEAKGNDIESAVEVSQNSL